MRQVDFGAESLIKALLGLAGRESVCILDSCGVGHLGSHLLIAGIRPVEVSELTGDANHVLAEFNERSQRTGRAGFFTLSYDLGRKLLGIGQRSESNEPDLFFAEFDCLTVHDYKTGQTFLTGNRKRFDETEALLHGSLFEERSAGGNVQVNSNFTRPGYIDSIETIREYIRDGHTYQTNLTQKLTAGLPEDLRAEDIFFRLRRDHPAPFAAFIKRMSSSVVSASPERFFHVRKVNGKSIISASPIKGTRPRGETKAADAALRDELLTSAKDRAENTMIVDLLRNDLGRVCEYGSVRVEKLCDIEEHPTIFHLVSTICGDLRDDIRPSEILEALFPCGSITGAPKIRTMQIIDKIEPHKRGLSMGAIGYAIPETGFPALEPGLDTSVAIRTMVIESGTATFNVGGGVVIDSNADSEFEESLLKAKALINALGT